MCGINGIISWRRDVEHCVSAMNRHLGHRGPDGAGVFRDGRIALGHVRLSILDRTSAGAQPMQFNQLVLVYNGELYNFKELRAQLIDRGYEFVSRSDTEVLLKAWDCWGQDSLHRFEGMFAFALFNIPDQRLYICRDSYGVKPLFYCYLNDEFLFSSELATLVQALSVRPAPDHDALATFLALHYVPAPQTGLMHIHKLQAGHLVTVRCSASEVKIALPCAWHKPFTPMDNPKGLSLDILDKALEQSVRQQMISDVPVGAFLSGGVDSSLLCHYAAKNHPEPIHTFSIGFTDAGPEYDETAYAAQAAQIVRAQHHAVQVQLTGLTDRINTVLDQLGELNADTSVFLNHIVCQEARKYVGVCLSGAGGDELFGGYFRHQALLALQLLQHIPQPLTRFLHTLLQPLPQNRDQRLGNLVRRLVRFIEQHNLNQSDFLTIIRQDRDFPQDSAFFNQPRITTLLKALEFDFHHFLGDNILDFTDKMSMLHSLEVRVPFLDSTVVRLAEQMHNTQRVTLTAKKILLKQLAARYFPRDLIYRKKQGFAAPVEVWLRNLSQEELKERCFGSLSTTFAPEAVVDELIHRFIKDKRDVSLQLYALIVMNEWYKGIN